MKTFRRCFLTILFGIAITVLIACQSIEAQSTSSLPDQTENELVIETVIVETAVIQPYATHPSTASPTPTPLPTITPLPVTLTNTPPPTPTPSPTFPKVPVIYAGTEIPASSEPISLDNFSQLTHVAQWGNGDILGVTFSPDGEFFIVGSAIGFAIYNSNNPNVPPQWISWEHPYFYESLFFSTDGIYLLLENRQESRTIRFADGQIVNDVAGISWIKPSKRVSYNDNVVISADQSQRFTSHSISAEDNVNIEIVIREIYDNITGELLYTLPDETLYVQYNDYNEPEGCDLKSFSMCGNAYDPSAMQPYRVAFSPNGKTISVLYRASNLWNTDQFSLLHVYSLDDGRVVARIGDFAQPVETFSYAPDGQSLLVAYGNGAVQMWDMGQIQPAFRLWHFDAPILKVVYSFDGRYLLIQRQGWVEKRRTDNGILQARYQADVFALSSTTNLLALGNQEGQITIQDMDTEQPIHTIPAHEAKIYALAFSPDGAVLTSSGEDCRVQSWDVATGHYLHDFAENSTQPYEELTDTVSRIFIKNMAYVADTDQLIGYGSWSRVVSWQASSGATNYMIEPEPLDYYNGMITLKPHFPEFLSFNPYNQSFLLNYVEYDLETGERLGEYQPPETLSEGCASVGPTTVDGNLMFTKGYDTREGQICILNANDMQLLQTIEAKSDTSSNYDPIGWLYLSPDGRQLLVSSYSGVLQVYQVTEIE